MQGADLRIPKKLRKLAKKVKRTAPVKKAASDNGNQPPQPGPSEPLAGPPRPVPAHQPLSCAAARGGIVGRAAVSAGAAEERQRRIERAQRFAATAGQATAAESPVLCRPFT